jgi:lysophospholipase L1-like esterase
MAAASSTRKTPIRVLCLGDSLTAGFPAGTPYAARLRRRLEAAFPPATHDVRVAADGVPGDTVFQGRFAERAEKRFARAWYDWTIVLGGTK